MARRPELLNQSAVGEAVSAMIQPQPVHLDHEPQIKMASAIVRVEPLVGRRDRADVKSSMFQSFTGVEADEPIGANSQGDCVIDE